MSNFWFRRLPGSRREPAGAERVVLRRLPKILVIGSLLLALPALFVRLVLLPVDVKQRANSRKMASINPEMERPLSWQWASSWAPLSKG